MMKTNPPSKTIHAIYITLLLSSVAIGFVSHLYAKELGSILLNGWVQEQSDDITQRIELLQHLRSGNESEAIKLLDSQLDDDLIILQPDDEITLEADVRSKMYDALRMAQHYRKDYPRANEGIGIMVNEVLSKNYPE